MLLMATTFGLATLNANVGVFNGRCQSHSALLPARSPTVLWRPRSFTGYPPLLESFMPSEDGTLNPHARQ